MLVVFTVESCHYCVSVDCVCLSVSLSVYVFVLPVVVEFLSTQVSFCGDTLLPWRGDTQGSHGASPC